VRLLSLQGLRDRTYVQQPNVLATVVARPPSRCRLTQVAALQACDILFDFDMLHGDRKYRCTAAIKICKRKNDLILNGLFKFIGSWESRRAEIRLKLSERFDPRWGG
jgi:hypothetical protein